MSDWLVVFLHSFFGAVVYPLALVLTYRDLKNTKRQGISVFPKLISSIFLIPPVIISIFFPQLSDIATEFKSPSPPYLVFLPLLPIFFYLILSTGLKISLIRNPATKPHV